jgi:diacylglycerol kinase family enzyme
LPSTAVSVIVNTSSGLGHAASIAGAVRERFRALGIDAEVHTADRRDDISALATREAQRRAGGVVVAAGGDGTVSAVADAVRAAAGSWADPAGHPQPLRARMGIPLEADEAIRVIAAGHRVAVDVGEVNGAGFINNSSLGLYPRHRARARTATAAAAPPKRSAMLWAILATLRRAPLLRLQLRLDGGEQALRVALRVHRQQRLHDGGFHIGKRRAPRCGKLSIYTTTRRTAGALPAGAARALRLPAPGRGLQRVARAQAARRGAAPPDARRDRRRGGLMQTPLEYTILPRALNVHRPGSS